MYIADGYGNRRVVVFDSRGHYLRQWGRQGTVAEVDAGVGGVFLKVVHCVVIGNDGLVYVCDRFGGRIEVFDKMGNFQRNILVESKTARLTGDRFSMLARLFTAIRPRSSCMSATVRMPRSGSWTEQQDRLFQASAGQATRLANSGPHILWRSTRRAILSWVIAEVGGGSKCGD